MLIPTPMTLTSHKITHQTRTQWLLITSLALSACLTVPQAVAMPNISTSEVPLATKMEVRRTLDREVRRSEGGWTSGGGEGLACFENEEEKKNSFNDQLQITEAGRARIQRLMLLDAWEAAEKYQMNAPVHMVQGQPQIMDPYTFLVRRLERLFPIAPYFLYRIQESVLIIRQRQHEQSWDDIRPLPKLEDSGPIQREIPANCQRVQLAVRYAQSTGNGARPRVFVDQDAGLVQKMRDSNNAFDKVIFEAGLVLHEAVYMAAVELGAENSAQVRDMTMFLLSTNLDQEMARLEPHQRLYVFTTHFVNRGFKDIMKLFVPAVRGEAAPVNIERLRRAARSVTEKHQTALAEILKRHRERDPSLPPLGRLEVSNAFFGIYAPTLTPIEAFLQVAYNEHNRNRLNSSEQQNPLSMLVEGADPRGQIQSLCSFIGVRHNLRKRHQAYATRTGDTELSRGYNIDVPTAQTIFDRAVIYCLSEEYLSFDEILEPPT